MKNGVSDSELDPDLDPLVRGMDPGIRIRTKMSRILNTGFHKICEMGTGTCLRKNPRKHLVQKSGKISTRRSRSIPVLQPYFLQFIKLHVQMRWYTYKSFSDKNVINVYDFERPHILKERKNIFNFDNEEKKKEGEGGGVWSFDKRKGISPFWDSSECYEC